MATNLAAFKIQATPSVDPVTGHKIYRARSGELLALTLETSPAPGVSSVTYELYNPGAPSSPLASKSAREWWPTFLGFTESVATNVTPSGVQDTVHIQMPASTALPGSGAASWICRCRALTDSGEYLYERGIALNAFPDSWRETVPGERDEFEALGWNRTLDAQVQNSFPRRTAFKFGVSNTVVNTDVCAIMPTKSRAATVRARVRCAKGGGGTSIWTLDATTDTDGAGVVTLDANATLTGKTTGGTQVADTDFIPSIVIVSNQVVVRLAQLQAGTYTYKVWHELTEEPL